MIGDQTADRWKATFARERSVSYAEAVFWIALRDMDAMERAFSGGVVWDAEAPSMVDGIATLHDEWGPIWRQVGPRGLLSDALRLGDVTATGCRTVPMTHDQWAMQEREAIPVEAWAEVEVADGQGRWMNMTGALRRSIGLMHTMEAGWLNVRIDGETLRQAFPGPGVVSTYPGRPANENQTAPAVIDYSERRETLAAALAAVVNQGLEPSKGNLAIECARLYRERWGAGRSRSDTVAGIAQSIEKQWARPPRQRSLEWLINRARAGG